MEVAPHRPLLRSRAGARQLKALLACLASFAAIASPATAARVETKQATAEVERWTSARAFSSPIAVVDVRHKGRLLDGTTIDRCRRTYGDMDLTVVVSTCGKRWHVRATYVSLSGRDERFFIIYSAHG